MTRHCSFIPMNGVNAQPQWRTKSRVQSCSVSCDSAPATTHKWTYFIAFQCFVMYLFLLDNLWLILAANSLCWRGDIWSLSLTSKMTKKIVPTSECWQTSIILPPSPQPIFPSSCWFCNLIGIQQCFAGWAGHLMHQKATNWRVNNKHHTRFNLSGQKWWRAHFQKKKTKQTKKTLDLFKISRIWSPLSVSFPGKGTHGKTVALLLVSRCSWPPLLLPPPLFMQIRRRNFAPFGRKVVSYCCLIASISSFKTGTSLCQRKSSRFFTFFFRSATGYPAMIRTRALISVEAAPICNIIWTSR